MASIGDGWVDGAWVQAGWQTNAWEAAAPPALDGSAGGVTHFGMQTMGRMMGSGLFFSFVIDKF